MMKTTDNESWALVEFYCIVGILLKVYCSLRIYHCCIGLAFCLSHYMAHAL